MSMKEDGQLSCPSECVCAQNTQRTYSELNSNVTTEIKVKCHARKYGCADDLPS